MNHYRTYALALVLLVGLVGPAYAVPVYNTSALGELNGQRTEGASQIVTGGDYSGVPLDFTIAWDIDPIVGGYHYKYTFSGFKAPAVPELSHVILDLSPICTAAGVGCVQDPTSNGVIGSTEYGTFGPGPSNPGFPVGASIQGIKFDELSNSGNGFTIEFDSNRVPVYGDIYGKGGSTSFFYNAGLSNHASELITDFVALPDSQSIHTPEPSTWLLMSLGLVGLAAWRMRKRTAPKTDAGISVNL